MNHRETRTSALNEQIWKKYKITIRPGQWTTLCRWHFSASRSTKLLYFDKFSLEFVRECLCYDKPAPAQILAWRRPGDKPPTEPMKDSYTHANVHILITELNTEAGTLSSIIQTILGYFIIEIVIFWLRFHCDSFMSINVLRSLHWLKQRPGASQATSHHLNQWNNSTLTHICVIQPE